MSAAGFRWPVDNFAAVLLLVVDINCNEVKEINLNVEGAKIKTGRAKIDNTLSKDIDVDQRAMTF